MKIKSVKSGLFIFQRNEEALCAVKTYSNSGYGSRGEQWYKNMEYFKKVASSYDIPSDRLYFLVVSFRNGLDNELVKEVLGFTISNKDLLELEDRAYLEQYAKGWIDGAKDNPLPDLEKQCYFLASKLHPNIINEAPKEDLSVYKWFRPSVTELINTIKNL